ncbi:MAG: type II toxin-antitoxin system VapC family toxin [Sphingomonadales bacterium]
MYLVDTNVVSELRRTRPHGGVLAWFDGVTDAQLHLSAVTLGELQAGAEMTRRQDRDKADSIERWIDRLEGAWNVLPVDGRTFRLWACLFRGKATIEDGLIAATATQHNLTVVTCNLKDFEPLGIATVDPFAP